MSMFQKSVVNKYLANLDEKKVEKAYKAFKNNYTLAKTEKIKKLKEEEYQDGFLRDLFVDVLGYILNPDDNYNLMREFKNQSDGKKADGAILKDGKAIAVIELKSTKTKDLSSITQQAFNYKNNQPGCKYVITSNFQKLRFYIDYADEHEEFDLFTLSEEDFELLYLLLSKDSVFSDIPLKLKKESVFHEENVSKQLYKDYSIFKSNLFDNLIKNNPKYDKLTLFKKSQKLIDRFLFMLFAEDRGLLPPNMINRAINRFELLKDEDSYKPLYEIYMQFFDYLNFGRKGKEPADDIPGYNGGLFYPDEILDDIKIDDDALIHNLRKLSVYDFNSEVDVNILGHIFEHSLSEIEEVTAELEGTAVDKTKSKRKKDGVFYTPKYITQYIVENTIGTLCKEKRAELDIAEIEFDDSFYNKNGRLSAKGKKLFDTLEKYKKWLLSLKIVDPACGSGAFLNQALNFLIEEHRIIDDIIADLTKMPLGLFDVDKAILENNLYGVDINEESIEIAKLSLWLHTAQKGRKLSNLNDNIKCGNSLIDDPEVAGEKAFNWKEEFPEIMSKGGFDVVIGNPPYGATLDSVSKNYINKNFIAFNKNYDIYSAFIQLAFQLINKNGYWGYINPVSWQSNENYYDLRNYLKENGQLYIAIKLPYNVFADAYIDTGIYIANKKVCEYYESFVYEFPVYSKGSMQFLELKKLPSSYWTKLDSLKIVLNPSFYELLTKISKESIALSEITKSVRGILPRADDITVTKNENSKPYFIGNLYRYDVQKDFNWVNYGENLKEKPKEYDWFIGERILIRRLINRQFRVMASIVTDEFVNKKDLYILKSTEKDVYLPYLLSVVNSKLIAFLKTKGSTSATKDDFSQLTLKDIRDIPVILTSNETQVLFVEYVNKILSLNQQLQAKKAKFLNRVQDNFELEKISKKLDAFYDFEFKDFVGELKKQKIKLSLLQQDEWEEYFTAYKTEINNLQSEIAATDKTIDQMVYDLYGLTEDEIKIVEESS